MNGTTITLKNVPPELHKSLKEQAKLHKRSLNMEAIHCLENVFAKKGGESVSLKYPLPGLKAGFILKPLEDRSERQSELLERSE